jgi:hypothetical protein
MVASVVLIGPSKLCAKRLPLASYSEICSTTAVATGTVTEIVHVTPEVPDVQSVLLAIETEVGAVVGLGVAPLTVYTAMLIVAVAGETNAGLRVLDETPLAGMKTLIVAPVVWEAVVPPRGIGLEPAPPPPPQAAIKAANAVRPAPKSKR